MNMRVALIAKPLTGPRNKANDISQAIDQLAACHIHCVVFETQYHAHALKIVQGLPLSEFDALIAMGGDGTNYHLLNGVLRFHGDRPIPPLGIIPTGRGNSFAKDLNIHSMADGIAAIIRQRTLAVDVCRFTQG
ncbi:MAG: acylglycerol kinase family protein, partial [Deltaproteobacteria bacterium]|nr:acylglycerol kinase family protein [Deltaproteobacteria bacterium]